MADENCLEYSSVIDEVCKFGAETIAISKSGMDSLSMLDVVMANEIVGRSKNAEEMEKEVTELVVSSVQEPKLALALRGIVWNLAEISRSAQMVAEVAMNRYLESNTDMCQFWKERKSGGDIQYLRKVVA
jgi:type II secretory pathway component PulC